MRLFLYNDLEILSGRFIGKIRMGQEDDYLQTITSIQFRKVEITSTVYTMWTYLYRSSWTILSQAASTR